MIKQTIEYIKQKLAGSGEGLHEFPGAAHELEDTTQPSVHSFYELGACLRPLYRIEANSNLSRLFSDLFMAERALTSLLNNQTLPLVNCSEHAWRLINSIKSLLNKISEDIRPDFMDELDLLKDLRTFEESLMTELQSMKIYCPLPYA